MGRSSVFFLVKIEFFLVCFLSLHRRCMHLHSSPSLQFPSSLDSSSTSLCFPSFSHHPLTLLSNLTLNGTFLHPLSNGASQKISPVVFSELPSAPRRPPRMPLQLRPLFGSLDCTQRREVLPLSEPLRKQVVDADDVSLVVERSGKVELEPWELEVLTRARIVVAMLGGCGFPVRLWVQRRWSRSGR